ncbi:MAG: hypothetical protein ACI9VS_003269, partial [Candidatus Binatia bacterium]
MRGLELAGVADNLEAAMFFRRRTRIPTG